MIIASVAKRAQHCNVIQIRREGNQTAQMFSSNQLLDERRGLEKKKEKDDVSLHKARKNNEENFLIEVAGSVEKQEETKLLRLLSRFKTVR